jgi:hypothetical protein
VGFGAEAYGAYKELVGVGVFLLSDNLPYIDTLKGFWEAVVGFYAFYFQAGAGEAFGYGFRAFGERDKLL